MTEFYNQQTEAYQQKRQKRHRIDYGTIPGNTHKESGIVNDPNDWAREHNQPRHILDLLLSVIALSMKTIKQIQNAKNKTYSFV